MVIVAHLAVNVIPAVRYMNSPLLKSDVKYTWEDYLKWDDDVRYELLDGVPYALATPLYSHENIVMELSGQLYIFLKGKPCKVYASSGVKLDDLTVFRPDVFLICDKSKQGDRLYNGAPELVIEVLSPTSLQNDKIYKYQKYRDNGVKEYWIVYPEGKIIDVFLLEKGVYIHSVYGENDTLHSKALEGFSIKLSDVFAED